MFPAFTGTFKSPDNVLHVLRRVLKLGGLPWVRVHDLPAAHLCHSGPPERGGCENCVRYAKILRNNVHAAHLFLHDHVGPAGDGGSYGGCLLLQFAALPSPEKFYMGQSMGQKQVRNYIEFWFELPSGTEGASNFSWRRCSCRNWNTSSRSKNRILIRAFSYCVI